MGAFSFSATFITSREAFNAPCPTKITILFPLLSICAAFSINRLSGNAKESKISDVCPGTLCLE
jgi:hypothetical protein